MSEKQKWINAYHEAERELNAVTKQRDRLREAAEIGLEYAKGDLAQRKESFAGYPTCWIHEQHDVAFIEAALREQERGTR